MSADPTRLVLVRHAATADSGRRLSGPAATLSQDGRRQAAALADRLAGRSFDEVLCSPLARCRQTAEPLLAGRATPLRIVDELTEVDFGRWAGLGRDEVAAGWPDEFAAWSGDMTLAPPGGESLAAAADRMLPPLAAAGRRHPGGSIVVVGHGSLPKLLLHRVFGVGRRFLDAVLVSPAGISVVDSWPDGNLSLATLNDTAHL